MNIKKEWFQPIRLTDHKYKRQNMLTLNPFKYNRFNLTKGLKMCAMILESNGIAISGYEKEINCIIDIIFEYQKEYGCQNVGFNVNDLLEQNGYRPFSHIADIVYLNIFFEDNNTSAEYIDGDVKYKNGMVNEMTIQLVLDIYKFKHQKLLLSQLLFHEFNHAYEDSQRIKNGRKPLHQFLHDGNNAVNYKAVIKDITDDNMILPYITYRLFVDTELNALPALLYGELQLIKPNVESFISLVRKSEVYDIYLTCKKFYDEYVKTSVKLPPNIRKYFPGKSKLSDTLLLNWFKKQYKERLTKLWYKMWKEGYYYFNE